MPQSDDILWMGFQYIIEVSMVDMQEHPKIWCCYWHTEYRRSICLNSSPAVLSLCPLPKGTLGQLPLWRPGSKCDSSFVKSTFRSSQVVGWQAGGGFWVRRKRELWRADFSTDHYSLLDLSSGVVFHVYK